MSTPEPYQQFLKLEDLHNPSSSSPTPSTYDDCTRTQSTPPPPVVVQSRPAKKRKSWGQELPEPKTNLPPRKRAKTDDEKEQRRIERIKRNRAAAHNSRERKRQETETLAVALARANAELEAYRKLHGPLPASIVLPEVTLSHDATETPAPSSAESHPRDSLEDPVTRPASPVDSLFITSPQVIKQEPLETSFPVTLSPAFDTLDAKSVLSSASPSLDLTQHSAAMLCDLQCRSSRGDRSPQHPRPRHHLTSWWTRLFLSLMTFQLQTCYKTLLVALWTLSPSRMARLMQASTRRLTSPSTISSTTPQPLRSTHRRLALSSSATGLRASHRRGAPSALLRTSVPEHRRRAEVAQRADRELARPVSPPRRSAFGVVGGSAVVAVHHDDEDMREHALHHDHRRHQHQEGVDRRHTGDEAD